MCGRNHVIPEDLQTILPAVVEHRLRAISDDQGTGRVRSSSANVERSGCHRLESYCHTVTDSGRAMRLKTLNVRSALTARFARWTASRVRPKEKVTLDRRMIYILPTRHGLMFVFAASLVFMAAINYAVSLAFGLAFLMVSIFILSILYSFNNLNQLKTPRPCLVPRFFCGDYAVFKIELSCFSGRNREALELSFRESHATYVDIIKNDHEPVEVFIKTGERG